MSETQGTYVEPGKEFDRDTNYIEDRITPDGRDGWPGRSRVATG